MIPIIQWFLRTFIAFTLSAALLFAPSPRRTGDPVDSRDSTRAEIVQERIARMLKADAEGADYFLQSNPVPGEYHYIWWIDGVYYMAVTANRKTKFYADGIKRYWELDGTEIEEPYELDVAALEADYQKTLQCIRACPEGCEVTLYEPYADGVYGKGNAKVCMADGVVWWLRFDRCFSYSGPSGILPSPEFYTRRDGEWWYEPGFVDRFWE